MLHSCNFLLHVFSRTILAIMVKILRLVFTTVRIEAQNLFAARSITK